MSAKYRLRFFYDWGLDLPLWPDNDAARKDLVDAGPIDWECLPLSKSTIRKAEEIGEWHDTGLNWDYPMDPSPWRQEECDRFNAAVRGLFKTITDELGDDFEVINQQQEYSEDSDLDLYL